MSTSPDNREPGNSASETGTIDRILNRPLSRRRLLQGLGLGAMAVATKGLLLDRPKDALASTALDGGNVEPDPLPRPEHRDEYVRAIKITKLSIDEGLPSDPDRVKAIIDNVVISPYPEDYIGLEPDNPYDRIDRLFIELCRGLYPRSEEIKNISKGRLSVDDFTATPINQRALNGEVPELMPLDEFTQILKDDKKMRIPVWAYDDNSKNAEDFKLTEFDPRKGMEIRILKDPPLVAINSGNSGKTLLGLTHKVVDERLQLGLYLSDFNPASGAGDSEGGIYTPSYNLDWEYSNCLRAVIERMILYGGNTEMLKGVEVKYAVKRNGLPSASLFPSVAELACGVLTQRVEGFQAYDSAPVLHMISPSVNPLERSRK